MSTVALEFLHLYHRHPNVDFIIIIIIIIIMSATAMFPKLSFKLFMAGIALLTLLLLSLHVTIHGSAYETAMESIARSQIRRPTHFSSHPTDPLSTNNNNSVPLDFSAIKSLKEHLSPLLRCPHTVNNKTDIIRLPFRILSISLTPTDIPHNPTARYFNPAIIPLPPHSPYPYLLLSRLVTTGLHQESHICLATSCIPRNFTSHSQLLHVDSHLCSESDVEVLGHHGGIRCATKPQRLNIAPTPALRCEGAWSAFPDIPGFHDPRVFWSGKGEPLVIINSASQYACVGLWVVDLRAVYPEVRELLAREGKYTRLSARKENGHIEVSSKMSYPHLTELTRNPRKSRGAVEKNWILFFPRADETWIQYDLVGHIRHKPKERQIQSGDMALGLTTDAGSLVNSYSDTSNVTSEAKYVNAMSTASEHETDLGTDNSVADPSLASVAAANGTEREPVRRSRRSVGTPKIDLVPSRSFAKVIGSGYTTENLTAVNESPCLASTNLLDNLGNRGHWHQGSNSLRLILCSRQDIACLGDYDENELLNEGKVVHFAVLHRKFSNDLDLPMRYERYIMVWDARFPFRMVGISRYPILFAGERAQPWSDTENELEGDMEADRWAGVYFTYTPSLAWSWRKPNTREDANDTNTQLGTGHLGDDVIVGIGMDDIAQGFIRLKTEELVSCMRLCPDFEDVK